MIIYNSIINIGNIVKIYRNKTTNEYEAILDIIINISGKQTNTMKKLGIWEFGLLCAKLDNRFEIIDEDLIFNKDKTLYCTNYTDYLYITTISKIDIAGVYENYNIKVSGKEKSRKIFGNLGNTGVKVLSKNFNDVIINIKNINNIVVENKRIIVNFTTNMSLNNSKNIIPAFEIVVFDNNEEKNEIISQLTRGRFHKVFYNNVYTYINLDNVFLIKKDERKNRIIFNLSSNIYKEKFGKRILSTVHIYQDFKTFNEMKLEFQKLIK